MTIKTQPDCQLWSTIKAGQFYTITDEQVLRQVQAAFPTELDRIKRATAVERGSPPRITFDSQPPTWTPSEILFDTNYDEVNRTLVGVLALRWIWNDEYTRFTNGQADDVRLTEESFAGLRHYYQDHIKSNNDLFLLILSMVVNDLGKDPRLVADFQMETGDDLTGHNHDSILLEVARAQHADLIPALSYLKGGDLKDLIRGLELGSQLNAAQLAQAENVPANLEALLHLRGQERAFHLKFMEQILDVAGSAGHTFSDGAKSLTEPAYQAFSTVRDVSLQIINQNCSLRQGYDMVLIKRAEMLHHKGFRMLNVEKDDERALLRILTMGRTASKEQAELFDRAFGALEDEKKQLLIRGLNIDATDAEETAVLPYYMPAMLAETLQNTQDSPKRTEALTSIMRYLARVLDWTDEHEAMDIARPLRDPQTWPGAITLDSGRLNPESGRVFERNMTKARDTIRGPAFKLDPRVLDSLDPPEGHLLVRRRTSQSVASV